MRRLALMLGLLLLLPAPLRAVTAGPVAVLPFKNLNADPESEWLTNGVAETMITDMKKSGLIKVVERKQLDAALTEIALQGLSRTDPSTAARVGKMVGAKAVVVGSFQRAGGQLRFVARMVDVETGLIAETAKVTGPAYQVFNLQDRIATQLLGLPPPKRRRRKTSNKAALVAKEKKKAEAKLKAYRLYAMSLNVASDADRVGWLQKAVKIDPDFEYAVDDLAELEARMKVYRQEHEVHVAQQNEELRSELEAEKDPSLRMQKAMMLLSSDMVANRWNDLLIDAQTVYDLEWEKPAGIAMWVSPRESAANYMITAYRTLKKRDLALQLGEKFLKEFPKSMMYRGVEMIMQSLIDEKKAIAQGRGELPTELARIEAEREERIAESRERGREIPPIFFLNLDQERCVETYRHKQYESALDECARFIEQYDEGPEGEFVDRIFNAHFYRVLCFTELGRFADARELVGDLKKQYPERTEKHSVLQMERHWPR